MKDEIIEIAFAGIDGAGKTTQIKMLKEYLERNGIDVEVVRFASDNLRKTVLKHRSIFGNMTKEYEHFAQALGLLSSMYFENKNVEKRVIIYDRCKYCRIAAAILYKVKNIQIIKEMYSLLPDPQIVIYLDLDPKIAYRRIEKRGYDKESLEELIRFSEIYEEILPVPLMRIDATRDTETIHNDIIKKLEKIIKGD